MKGKVKMVVDMLMTAALHFYFPLCGEIFTVMEKEGAVKPEMGELSALLILSPDVVNNPVDKQQIH